MLLGRRQCDVHEQMACPSQTLNNDDFDVLRNNESISISCPTIWIGNRLGPIQSSDYNRLPQFCDGINDDALLSYVIFERAPRGEKCQAWPSRIGILLEPDEISGLHP